MDKTSHRNHNGFDYIIIIIIEIVKHLVENGADVNAKDENKATALTEASKNGHLEIVKYLSENGADVI